MENMAINRAQRCGFCILVYLKIKKGREKKKKLIIENKLKVYLIHAPP
jgi:hypothetical protein